MEEINFECAAYLMAEAAIMKGIVQNNKALAKRADQLGAGLLDLDGYARRLAEVTSSLDQNSFSWASQRATIILDNLKKDSDFFDEIKSQLAYEIQVGLASL